MSSGFCRPGGPAGRLPLPALSKAISGSLMLSLFRLFFFMHNQNTSPAIVARRSTPATAMPAIAAVEIDGPCCIFGTAWWLLITGCGVCGIVALEARVADGAALEKVKATADVDSAAC